LPDDVKNMISQPAQVSKRAALDTICVRTDAWVNESVLFDCIILELKDATKDVEEKLFKSLPELVMYDRNERTFAVTCVQWFLVKSNYSFMLSLLFSLAYRRRRPYHERPRSPSSRTPSIARRCPSSFRRLSTCNHLPAG
jgi:hypothetical protein